MPIGFAPGETLTVMFPIDEHLPDAQRVRWECKALSVAEARELRTKYRKAAEADDNDKSNDFLNATILEICTGWSLGELNAELLDRHMSLSQKYIFLRDYTTTVGIGEYEKKASRLRPASAPEASAATASEPVTTSPAPKAP